MVWKKSFISVILWIVYFVGISISLLYYIFQAVLETGFYGMDTAAFIAVGSLSGIVLLFVLCRLLIKCLPASLFQKENEAKSIVEGMLFIALITAGLFLRLIKLDGIEEITTYFDMAKITSDLSFPELTHGATFFYIYLLRALFVLVGNKWMAGIWLQLVLQFAAVIILYVAVRKLAGAITSLSFLGLMMLLPTEIARGLSYSPQLFYLCIYAIGLFFAAMFLKRQVIGRNRWDWVLLLFCGAWIGISCYLDVMGITLLLPVFFALHVYKENQFFRNVVLQVITILLLALVFFTGCICLDSYLCETDVLSILNAWFVLFSAKKQDMWFWYCENKLLSGIIVFSIMIFGSLGFWITKKQQKFSLWISILFAFCVLQYFHIPVQNMDGGMFLLIIGSILGGLGIQECFYREKTVDSVKLDEIHTNHIESDDIQDGTVQNTKPENYIQNPLPLPKKHVKRNPDYNIIPEEDHMHFDIEVDQNDDFDI